MDGSSPPRTKSRSTTASMSSESNFYADSHNNHCSNRSSTHKALEEAKDLVSSFDTHHSQGITTPARGIAQRRRSSSTSSTSFDSMQRPTVNGLRNATPSRSTSASTAAASESDSIQGRRSDESRKEYLHRVLDRVTELGERKQPAKPKTSCHHDANYNNDTTATQQQQDGATSLPPPPPSYDEALALGLFLDDKLALDQESTSSAASTHSRVDNSRRALRRSRPLNHTASQAQGLLGSDQLGSDQQDQPSHEQPTRRRSARKGSLVERAHSLASEGSARAEMERIRREFADLDDDEQDTSTTATRMSRSTRQSRDDVYKHPPALDDHGHGKEEESESGASLLLVAKRDRLPSMKDAQSRPYVG